MPDRRSLRRATDNPAQNPLDATDDHQTQAPQRHFRPVMHLTPEAQRNPELQRRALLNEVARKSVKPEGARESERQWNTDQVQTHSNTNPYLERQRDEAALTKFVPQDASWHEKSKDHKQGPRDYKKGVRKSAWRQVGEFAGEQAGATFGVTFGTTFAGPLGGLAGYHYVGEAGKKFGGKIGERIGKSDAGKKIGEKIEKEIGEFDAKKFGKRIIKTVWEQW